MVLLVIVVAAITVAFFQHSASGETAGFESSCGVPSSRPYDYKYMSSLYKGQDCGCGCDGEKKAELAKRQLFGTAGFAGARHMGATRNMGGAWDGSRSDPDSLTRTATTDRRYELGNVSTEMMIQQDIMNARMKPGGLSESVINAELAHVSEAAAASSRAVTSFGDAYASLAASGSILEKDPINAHQDSKINVPNMPIDVYSLRPAIAPEGLNTVAADTGRSRNFSGNPWRF